MQNFRLMDQLVGQQRMQHIRLPHQHRFHVRRLLCDQRTMEVL